MSGAELIVHGEVWRGLAEELDLLPVGHLAWGVEEAGVALRLEVSETGPGTVGVAVTVSLAALEQRSEVPSATQQLFAAPRRLALRADQLAPTGDQAFDQEVWLGLPTPEHLGLFDHGARLLLRALIADGVMLAHGRLQVSAASSGRIDPKRLGPLLKEMLAFSRTLALGGQDLDERLLTLADDDPMPGVREHLERLIEARPRLKNLRAQRRSASVVVTSEHSLETLGAFVRDTTLDVIARGQALARLFGLFPLEVSAPYVQGGGTFLGLLASRDKGTAFVPVVNAIIAACRRPDSDPDRCEAVLRTIWPYRPPHPRELNQRLAELLAALGRRSTFDLVGELLGYRDELTFRAALAALMRLDLDPPRALELLGTEGLHRAKAALPGLVIEHRCGGALLAAIYEGHLEGEPQIAQSFLTAFGQLGDARFEPLVLAALDGPEDGLELMAIEALGGLGTRAAIARLEPLTQGLFRPRALKSAAQEAIARIRERHGQVDRPGALSLAGADAGALTLSDPAPGHAGREPKR